MPTAQESGFLNDPYFFFFDKKWEKTVKFQIFSLFFLMKIPQKIMKKSQTFMKKSQKFACHVLLNNKC